MRRKQRPTQVDIARAAGVSPAVVSLVINGRTNGKIRISEETQVRVWTAIREQGYVPNMAARQLAGGRNHLLGVFTYEAVFPMQQNDFYYPFLVGIEEQAEESGYDLLLFTRAATGNGRRQIYRDGVNALQAADGAILIGTNEDRAELVRLHKDRYPFVFVGRREIDDEPLAYVAADYAGATGEIVDYLVARGHKELLYVGSPTINESAVDRENGYRAGLERHRIPLEEHRLLHMQTTDLTVNDLCTWVSAGITAIVAEQMATALLIRHLADELQIQIPRDLSLAVLGNFGDTMMDLAGITTFLIPRREMGAHAVRLLHDILEGTNPDATHQITLPCIFVEGHTVGAPRHRAASR